MERFVADQKASVPKACQGCGKTMAAYRFFDNYSIDWQAIMRRTGSRRSDSWLRCLHSSDFANRSPIGYRPFPRSALPP